MVQTVYPDHFKYLSKWTILGYAVFFFVPIQSCFFMGHITWKRGKLPRLAYNDQKYTKFMNGRGGRENLLHVPALEYYPDMQNKLYFKYIRNFIKKHRDFWGAELTPDHDYLNLQAIKEFFSFNYTYIYY